MTVQDSWVTYGSNGASNGPARAFFWDWYQRAEHGAELLGDVKDRAVVEVGAGAGKQAAFVAATLAPTRITAVDSSPAQHARARELHTQLPNLDLVHADAADYLRQHPGAFHVCYSVFGAVDFTDPHTLLPAIANTLAPQGLFVFSTLGHFHTGQPAETDVRPAKIPVQQADGTRGTLDRWVLEATVWTKLLNETGFENVETLTVHDPGAEGRPAIVTNIFCAHRSR